jgi:ATP-dependent helicase/nuclease subunit A
MIKTISPPDDATLAQIRAADPASSTWVSANAGSGKTRVLTDRVARLLLKEVPPQRILCLTYTKAAASHMQIQLFERLGSWAMLEDAELSRQLVELGEDPNDLSPEFLRRARTLFAQALETPGGLKIQTIHSFCAALLRRFPLEAGVSPGFQEIDERSGKKLRADILEEMADSPDRSAFDGMARYLSGDDPDGFIRDVAGSRDDFFPIVEKPEIWRCFGLPDEYKTATYLSTILPEWVPDILPDLQTALTTGGVTDNKNANILGGINLDTPTMETAETLENMFVYGDTTKNPNTAKTGKFPTKTVREAHPDLIEAIENLMLRFAQEKPNRIALLASQKTLALHQFARAFLPRYDRAKQIHGWLDFDDLILKARGLLTDSTMAQWVLFKLDGGIDHILVDEAQDTSPNQWAVIARLAEEFLTGEGARNIDRTIFVVGDEKQSIFSFQGANPAAFAQMRDHFDTRLTQARSSLNKRELLFSFRSSTAILQMVDAILQNNRGDLPANVTHRAFHNQLPGRVDLWPFLVPPEKSEIPVWYEPLDMPKPDDPAVELAKQIANAIAGILDREETIITTKGLRRIVAGDFLILVQRRSAIFHEIIKALKDKQLPVAGSDRLKIGGELAVRDLIALLSFMVTPEDDLSLAATLRSPLFRLTEGDLFRLAHGRVGYLWQEVRRQKDSHLQAFNMLDDMLKQVDFQRPYELLERILTKHKGREHLIARLGHEAEDGIDALLTQAMQYEQTEAPSLTGFLGWMSKDESDIKRQMDTRSSEIRVMTVHGAKGLESPIVVLPDTSKRNPPKLAEIQNLENGLAVWKSARATCPPMLQNAMDAKQLFLEQERMRLLYVALTRAENWLIVCGAGNPGEERESWYMHVAAGLDQLGTVDVKFENETIRRFEAHEWAKGEAALAVSDEAPPVTLPQWALDPAPSPKKKSDVINPSKLGGEKVIDGAGQGRDEESALRHGRQLHALLELLPTADKSNWAKLAAQILNSNSEPYDEAENIELLAEATTILENPDLAFIFTSSSLAEVEITAQMEPGVLFGVIDRLVITETKILAVDFKSNLSVPALLAEVPLGYLRQMGAYAAGLAQIYPDHKIETAILWTKPATLMRLPHELVTDAFLEVTAS